MSPSDSNRGKMFDFNHKRAQWLLFGSLALNLFLLGAISVHWFGPGHLRHGSPKTEHMGDEHWGGGRMGGGPGFQHRRGEGPGGPELMRDVVRVMGGPRDPRVREVWQARRGEQRQHRERLKTAREAALQALEAAPFEPQRLESALSELQRAQHGAQQAAQSGIVDLARQLTQEERRRLRERR